jgi:hypothetical protein
MTGPADYPQRVRSRITGREMHSVTTQGIRARDDEVARGQERSQGIG